MIEVLTSLAQHVDCNFCVLYDLGPNGFYILENLQPRTTYDFRFGSKNLVGFSEWGAGKQLTMPQRGPPEKPRINILVSFISFILFYFGNSRIEKNASRFLFDFFLTQK